MDHVAKAVQKALEVIGAGICRAGMALQADRLNMSRVDRIRTVLDKRRIAVFLVDASGKVA